MLWKTLDFDLRVCKGGINIAFALNIARWFSSCLTFALGNRLATKSTVYKLFNNVIYAKRLSVPTNINWAIKKYKSSFAHFNIHPKVVQNVLFVRKYHCCHHSPHVRTHTRRTRTNSFVCMILIFFLQTYCCLLKFS